MSKIGRLTVIGVLLSGATAPTAGQTVEQQRDRIATLEGRWGGLQRSMERLRNQQDTVVVDGVRVVVTPESRTRAAAIVRRALAELAGSIGPVDQHLLNGWLITWLRDAGTDSASFERAVARTVRSAREVRLVTLGGQALVSWAPWWLPDKRDLEITSLALLTSPAVAARACLDGDLVRCRAVLELSPEADPAGTLFDPPGRRFWVERQWESLRTAGPGVPDRHPRWTDWFHRCVDAHEDEACLLLMRERPSPVIDAWSRRSVVSVALELGGDGALTRLVADSTAPLLDRLASAAGVSADSLLHVWHSAVRAAAPLGRPIAFSTGFTTLASIAVVGALALRSTRWR